MEPNQPKDPTPRHDYTKEIIGRRNFRTQDSTAQDNAVKASEPIKKRRSIKISKKVMLLALAIFIPALLGLSWLGLDEPTSPVPKNIRKSVSFPIYLPDEKKIPRGYELDKTSFTKPQSDVVIYNVTNTRGQKINVSLQAKPEVAVIDNFYKRIIPLRYEVSTQSGTGQIGAYHTNDGTQTIASLPTNDKVWVLITAPEDIKQAVIEKVLISLRK